MSNSRNQGIDLIGRDWSNDLLEVHVVAQPSSQDLDGLIHSRKVEDLDHRKVGCCVDFFERIGLASHLPQLLRRLHAGSVPHDGVLDEAGSITPHRLLWEYGKDTLGPQTGRSFTESEWREWLQTLARQTLADVKAFSTQTLSESAARPDLRESEVFARMSDLIDGSFLNRRQSGTSLPRR